MYHEDWLIRQFQEMARVLAQVLPLKEEGRLAQALQALQDGCRELLGVDLDRLCALEEEDVVLLLTAETDRAPERLALVAALLLQSMELGALSGGDRAATARRAGNLAVRLLARAVTLGPQLKDPALGDVARRLLGPEGSGTPAADPESSFVLASWVGPLPRAEDELFRWFATAPERAREAGLRWVDLLEAMDDEGLEQAGLPREDLASIRRDLQAPRTTA